MNQENRYLTVTALNKYISYKFDADNHLRRVYIKGEISNFRISNGHCYFVLKDDNSEISAIMFQSYARGLKFKPQDGMTVLVEAQVSVYQKKGTYSLNVFQLDEVGLGQLYLNFLQLKQKLELEGLFDPKYKKPIPLFPEKIGVITSGTGDALHDIVSTINKRFPLAEVFLYPALVQGADAPKDLIRAVRKANLDGLVEVIILGRGGGSFEDLSAFNDELLAREVFKSAIPIVSAIGHESDFTICDFVADFRAPTPTGAAVKVTQDKGEILNFLKTSMARINSVITNILKHQTQKLTALNESYGMKSFLDIIKRKEDLLTSSAEKLHIHSPINKINNNITSVENYTQRLVNLNLLERINYLDNQITSNINFLDKYTINTINLLDDKINKNIDKLYILNPLNLIQKGYTISYQNNKIVRKISDINIQGPIDVRFADGIVSTKILTVKEEKINE